jgi:hypothetical protein
MSIGGLLFSELALKKSNLACWSSIKRTSSSSHCKFTCSRHDIAEKWQDNGDVIITIDDTPEEEMI